MASPFAGGKGVQAPPQFYGGAGQQQQGMPQRQTQHDPTPGEMLHFIGQSVGYATDR